MRFIGSGLGEAVRIVHRVFGGWKQFFCVWVGVKKLCFGLGFVLLCRVELLQCFVSMLVRNAGFGVEFRVISRIRVAPDGVGSVVCPIINLSRAVERKVSGIDDNAF